MRPLVRLVAVALGLVLLGAAVPAAGAATSAAGPAAGVAISTAASATGAVTSAGSGGGGGASVAYAEPGEDDLQLFVQVPRATDVALDQVTVDVAGETVTSSAAPAAERARVDRRAVLAIDTSNSMRGARFAAAKRAANAYLDTVPQNVAVGVVSFAGDVQVPLEPTEDRAAARDVIAGLGLSRGTRLYEGVTTAVEQLGTQGQRSLLVLSDGADTTDTPVEEATAAISDAGVRVDVVSLQGQQSPPLATMAEAGEGAVIDSSATALAQAFSARAEELAQQVLVTAEVPEQAPAEGTVTVSLPTGGDTVTAAAFLTLRESSGPQATGPQLGGSGDGRWFAVPQWLVYVAVVLVGVGLLLFFGLLLPRLATQPLSAGDRVERYARLGRRDRAGATAEASATEVPPEVSATDRSLRQARDAASQVLQRNRGLESRISARLEAAGTTLKSAEWLLLHAAIVVGAGMVATLLGGGSLLVGVLGLVLGAVLPWVWLGFLRRRRRTKFHTLLPETLGLISGSLSAGLSLTQSLDTIVREGEEPMAGEFRRVLVETRLGVTVEDALQGVGERFESRDFTWVVMAIRIQRQVGGNLAELLDTVAKTMREREYLRRQVAALSAEGRLSAWVLGGLPPLFLLYLVLTQRDYVMPLFTEPLGLVMLVGGSVWLAVGVFWMSKLVKVEV